jgi:enoyl-CoA hydratase
MQDESPILTEVADGIAVLTLNRPRALNALNLEMLHAMWDHVTAWRDDPGVSAVVVLGAGGRAFSAGGDVHAVVEHRGDDVFMHEVYRAEYVYDGMIHHYPKPYIPFMDGIVMGGGAGVSVHAPGRRIVTEKTMFAMPETALGLFPDMGASHFLAGAPGSVGMYLSLTGVRIGAADVIHANFADHHMPSAARDDLIAALRAGEDADAAIARLSTDPGPSSLADISDAIERCFAADSIEGVIAALEAEEGEWAAKSLELVRAMCPFSQAVTFKDLHMGAGRTIEECLSTAFRIALRFMDRDDYFEGARAILIDKDNAPRWNPETIEKVDPAEVDACFAPLGDRFKELAFE